jgi:hypothetical protein
MKGQHPILSNYTDVLQTQLITEKDKPKSWFATREGIQYVVKGPIPREERDQCMKSQRFKELLGVPHTYMYEDGEYLIQRCLGDYTALQTEIRSSRWEKRIRVPTQHQGAWSETYFNQGSLHPSLALSLLEGLLFRKIMGTNDTCAQNFVVYNDIVYCIDDRSMDRELPYMWKGPVKNPRYTDLLNTFWDTLLATMERWRHLLQNAVKQGSLKEEEVQFALRILQKMENKECWKFHK